MLPSEFLKSFVTEKAGSADDCKTDDRKLMLSVARRLENSKVMQARLVNVDEVILPSHFPSSEFYAPFSSTTILAPITLSVSTMKDPSHSHARRYGFKMNTLALLFVLLSAVSPVLSQSTNFQCSATKPCAVGCCGPFGICGLGPDFCAPGVCVSSCDAKAECDPANWGPTYVTSETCPLNVCCSQFGFCGTTEEFCGSQVVANPSCPGGISATQKTIAYYEGWSVTRACDVMYPEQIPVSAYTHINFAFASIDPNTFSIAPASESDVPLYSRLTALKTLFPNLQV